MRFKGLDLNLLVALNMLVEVRSVSRAAERLNLSQPAMSAALARLREYFKEPLLVPQGRRMIPTAAALSLQQELQPILADLDALITQSTAFDPATSRRCFRICASDYLVAVLFPQVIPAIQAAAPGISLDIVPPSEQAQIDLERGELDILLTPEEHCVAGHPTNLLFEEQHVIVGWSGNPLLQAPLSEEAFRDAGHVAVRIGLTNRASFAETQLDQLGQRRRIEISAASFTSVPDLLVGTDRLAVMHKRLAVMMAGRMAIAWQNMPFAFPIMRQMIQFNRARADDAGLIWLIRQLHYD
ncbi:LysR family transcriptional regulator [Alteraurantiacibacter aquimixticola]|uniref:LysR family transcriptional regulator n=1 Tax=Alteraurantiacibacter aquimixticola TaxID=2489173 RepID=A0A4T3F5M7_9SPHN|nr:LysR family transcriptional regulator [Alteraurantiacibacter aquimixticola]TIX50922.1 LysR family transcriptional regulator [Alteraurantiacibacter aquimixticola]